jgi:BirA family biotin operon repressor/biotin-[acetyl-CoA-carboxylase] ligase
VIVDEAPASQFDVLRELLGTALQLPGPTACLALSGRGFHGQRNRPWLAAPGNLHLCVVFPEPQLAARHAPLLAALPTVAVVDAVRALTAALEPGIKWVNDVLLDGRKIAGVLTSTQTQGDRLTAVLLGIGLNVASVPPVETTPFVPSAGSLAAAGASVGVIDALAAVLDALAARMIELVEEGPGLLLDAYRAASLVIGREVCVFDEAALETAAAGGPSRPFARGTVRGIGDDLSLLLDTLPEPVTRGRLVFAERCEPLER